MKHNIPFIVLSGFAVMLLTACDNGKSTSLSERRDTVLAPEEQSQNLKLCTEDTKFLLGKSFLADFGLNNEKVKNYPLDVQCFIENAATCEHFAGEEGYDEERRKEIVLALDKYCNYAKFFASSLKRKYIDNISINKILSVCDSGAAAVCSSSTEFIDKELDTKTTHNP
jgi:hypothetical protein